MTERRNGEQRERTRGPTVAAPETVEEALARAGRHTRGAIAEGLSAARALLDAASLAASGVPSDRQRRLSGIAHTLDSLIEQISGPEAGEALLGAVLEALDEEIERWEDRSREDPEARPVLRAFLGMREILWELGVRPAGEAEERRSAKDGGTRVQRVTVED